MAAPKSLAAGGRKLWDDVTEAHPELEAVQLVQLEEACRSKDRCDKLDRVLRGEVADWLVITEDRDGDLRVTVDGALGKANETANLMKQLLAAMRLPDANGKRPQQRGGARGAYGAKGGAKVSSLAAARARAGA